MALRIVTVKSAGGDYSSLNAAFVGEVGNLVTLGRQLEIDYYNFVDTTAATAGAGWTTDATHTVLVAAVDNHGGRFGGAGGTSAVSLAVAGSAIDASSAGHFTFRGLSISISAPGTAIAVGQNSVVDRVIASMGAGAFGGSTGIQVDASSIAVNSLVLGTPGQNQFGFYGANAAGTAPRCYNCTSYGTSIGFVNPNGGGMVAVNCLAMLAGTFSGTAFDLVTTTWTGSSNCASDDASIPTSGTGHRARAVVLLNGVASGDYHLDASDAGAKGYGADLSADATFPFSIDITGATRTVPWDIGAFLPTGSASFGYLLEFVRLQLEDGSGVLLVEDASGALLNEISAISDTADRLILEDSSGIISLEATPITGTGSLAASCSLSGTGQQQITGTGSVAVQATLAGTGLRGNIGTGSVAVTDTLSGSGQQRHTGTGSVAASFSLSGRGLRGNIGTGSVAVTTTLSGSGQQRHTGTGAITVALSLSGTGVRGHIGTGAITVSESLAGSGQQRHTGTGSVAFAVSLSGTGLRGNIGTGSVSVSETLSGSGQQRHAATGNASVALTLAGSGQQRHSGTGAVTTTLTLAGSGTVTSASSASGSVAVVLTLAGSGQQRHSGTGSASATVSLSGTGQQQHSGSGSVAVTDTLSGSGQQQHTGAGSVAVSVSLTGTGQQQHSGSGDVDVPLSLSGTGSVSASNITGTGDVAVTFSLAGTGDVPVAPANAGGIVYVRRPKSKERNDPQIQDTEGEGSTFVWISLNGTGTVSDPPRILPPETQQPPRSRIPLSAERAMLRALDGDVPAISIPAPIVSRVVRRPKAAEPPTPLPAITGAGSVAFTFVVRGDALVGTRVDSPAITDPPSDDAPLATPDDPAAPTAPVVRSSDPRRPAPIVSSIVAPITGAGMVWLSFGLQGKGVTYDPAIGPPVEVEPFDEQSDDDDLAMIAGLYFFA